MFLFEKKKRVKIILGIISKIDIDNDLEKIFSCIEDNPKHQIIKFC